MADSFVQITDLSSVQSLDVPDGARAVLVQAEAQDVRYRMDGGSPATDAGMVLGATDPPNEFVGAIALLRFIEASSGAKLNVQFR